jgi:hypothetical protein
MLNFERNKIPFYVIMFLIILIFSTFGNKLKDFFKKQEKEDEYAIIRKY